MSIEQKGPETQTPSAQTQSAATQRRYRTLAVVRQEAITRVEKPLEDSVFVWPHLLVREFFAATIVTVMITLLALRINAPLRLPARAPSWRQHCRLSAPTSPSVCPQRDPAFAHFHLGSYANIRFPAYTAHKGREAALCNA